jgi:hypothetical protein
MLSQLAPSSYRRLTTAVIFVMLLVSVVGIVVPAGLGWDFANFYDAGRKALVGQIGDLYDPSVPIAGQPPQGSMAFWGTPISSYLYAPLGVLSPGAALVVFKVQNTLALWAALAILYWHCRRMLDDTPGARAGFAALFVFLALIYQPFWTIYRVGGQTTPTVLLLVVVGLVCHSASHLALSAACLVLAALIKPSFGTMLAFLMLVSGWRFFAIAVALLAAVGAFSVLAMGWPVHAEYLERMLVGTRNSTAWMYNSALSVWVENLRLLSDPASTAPSRPPMLTALITAIRLVVVLVFAHLYWLARRVPWSAAARRHRDYLLAILFSLLTAPTVWEHYLALLFVPLAYLVASRRYWSREALWITAAIFLFAMGQNLIFINWLDTHAALNTLVPLLAVGFFKSAPLLLALILLWRHGDELFASYRAPVWNA